MFWSKKDKFDTKLLADILSSQLAQASLFKVPQYKKDQNLQDAMKIVSFCRQSGYSTWAAEAWLEVVGQIKRIVLGKDQREIDQAIGALRSSLNLLRVSFSAQEMLEKQADDNPANTKANKEVQHARQ